MFVELQQELPVPGESTRWFQFPLFGEGMREVVLVGEVEPMFKSDIVIPDDLEDFLPLGVQLDFVLLLVAQEGQRTYLVGLHAVKTGGLLAFIAEHQELVIKDLGDAQESTEIVLSESNCIQGLDGGLSREMATMTCVARLICRCSLRVREGWGSR